MSPQRIADAANIAPYLTHTLSHHGQITLIPPDNAGRVRQVKSKKPKVLKQETRKQEDGGLRFNTGPKMIRLPQPSSLRNNDRSVRNTSSRRPNQPTRDEEYADDIPDYPPPTFWEAISTPAMSVCPSTSTLPLLQNGHSVSRESSNPHPSTHSPSHPPTNEVRSPDVSSDSDSDGSLEVVEREPEEISIQRSQISDSFSNSEVQRGRSPNREVVDLDSSENGDGPPTPATFTPTKRRYMSLSPLRTLFPHRNLGLGTHERALSAHPSSPYSLSRNSSSFFRSTTSLSTNSFFRFPLSSPSCTSLAKPPRKGFSKGKERTFEALESWEVVESDNPTSHSLMSAVESMTSPPTPDSGTPSPTVIPVPANEPMPLPPLTDKKQPIPVVKKPARQRPAPSTQTQQTGVATPQSNAGPPPIVAVRTRNVVPPPLPQVTPSPALPIDTRQTSSSNFIRSAPNELNLAINTPLPPTPTDKKSDSWHPSPGHSHGTTRSSENSWSYPGSTHTQDEISAPLLRNTPASSMEKPSPSPLQLPFPASPSLSYSSGDSSSTTQTPLHTPSRRHYAGRPLPHPPLPSPEPLRGVIDSTYAPNGDVSLDFVGTQPCPEGLLIDFDESTPLSTHPTFVSARSSVASVASVASTQTVLARGRADNDFNSESESSSRSPSLTAMTPTSTDHHAHTLAGTRSTNSPQGVQRGVTSSMNSLSFFSSPTAVPNAGSVRDVDQVSSHQGSTTSSGRSDETRGVYSDVTDLDLLVSRMNDVDLRDGSNYDTLLLVSDFLGPGHTSQSTTTSRADVLTTTTASEARSPRLGQVFLDRRRVTKEGKVKVKLSLLDVSVDKCGICLMQFKEKDLGAMSAVCRHTFHEGCLRRWLDHGRAKTCPQCRMPLGQFRKDVMVVG